MKIAPESPSFRALRLSVAACLTALLGCAGEVDDGLPSHLRTDASVAADGGSSTPFDNQPGKAPSDAAVYRDAEPSLDAFFINDPAPPYCAPDGAVVSAEQPSGTPECPDDKNREGCACPAPGVREACWPGKRLNRNHGICQDGEATCLDTEFGLRWSPCQGYVLPKEGVLEGPSSCRCFSEGTWAIANLKPCIATVSGTTYLYSSHEEAGKAPSCESFNPTTGPTQTWTSSTLNVDCAGSFTLCYTIKAGDPKNRVATDCVINKQCVEIDYAEAGKAQALPSFPGWKSTDSACATKFSTQGGYGEMSVVGKSVECDAVDDGQGAPYVFYRTTYCKPGESCATGGSGAFGR